MAQVTGNPRRGITKLTDNDDVLISDAKLSDILAGILTGIVLAAGNAIIGWFRIKRAPLHLNSTGAGLTLRTLAPGAAYKLLGVRLHIGTGAPLAAAETLTVTLDSGLGDAYDTVLYVLDMGTPDIRDVVIPFGGEEDFYQAADAIVFTLSANAGGDTWGCETIYELV